MGVHDGHRKRLKQEFLDHGERFHDHQLLELLLFYSIPQGDVNELAHLLLNQFGSLAGILDALPEVLQQTPGVGEHTAVLLKLIPKMAGRYYTVRSERGIVLSTTRAIEEFLFPYYGQGPRNEMVYLVCMDSKCKVLGCHKLGEGSVNAADITSRRVVESALSHNATAVILAHNHVTGLPLPSNADQFTTRRLYEILGNVGVELMDHVIFGDGEMVSMRDSNMFCAYPGHRKG